MANGERINVTLRGRKFDISKSDAYSILSSFPDKHPGNRRGKTPEYFVIIGEKKIPIKAALKKIMDDKGIDLTLLDVTTKDAVGLFRRLNFPIVVERGSEGLKGNIMKYAGMFAFEGSCVEDKRGLYDNT